MPTEFGGHTWGNLCRYCDADGPMSGTVTTFVSWLENPAITCSTGRTWCRTNHIAGHDVHIAIRAHRPAFAAFGSWQGRRPHQRVGAHSP